MAIQNVIGGGDNAYLSGAGITAAGTSQATATTLTAQENEVTTVASGTGVVMSPFFSPGEEISVFNAGANALKVYPYTGVQINGLPVNTAMTLATNTGVIFRSVSATRVVGVLSA